MDEFSKFLEYLYVTGQLDEEDDHKYDERDEDSQEEDDDDSYKHIRRK